MRMHRITVMLSSAMCALFMATSANAALFAYSQFEGGNALVLDAGETVANALSGHYTQYSFSDPWYGNYLAARAYDAEVGDDLEYRNYFVFDLNGRSGPVTSAFLRLNSFSVTSDETYTLFDVQASIDDLMNGADTLGTFTDLGSGASYGQRFVGLSESDQVITFDLNQAFLDDLNAAIAAGRTQFVIGGSLTAPVRVPEPGTFWLMGLIALAFGVFGRMQPQVVLR